MIMQLPRAKDQALLDAFAPGDRKVWDNALASDAVYVDENGTIMNRAEFLKQLEPLAAGASGKLEITSYSAEISGDLAIVVHTDDEQENYHGQMVFARHLMTETWRREAGEWKLHLVHVSAMLKEPPAIALPAEVLEQYAGRYLAGSDLVYLIEWDGQQLMAGRQAGERDETVDGGGARRPLRGWRAAGPKNLSAGREGQNHRIRGSPRRRGPRLAPRP
jgi:hypothetical protein